MRVNGRDGDRCSHGGAAQDEVSDLGKAGGEGVDGQFGLIFFIIADCGDFAEGWGAPCLSGKESGNNEVVADLVWAISREADEFLPVGGVVGEDTSDPECADRDGCVKDVDGGLDDSALGGVIDTKGDQEHEQEEDNLVGCRVLEVKGCGHVGSHDGRTRAEAGWDVIGGDIGDAHKQGCNVHGGVFCTCTEEPWVIAVVP